MLRSGIVRTPVALYAVALAVRAVLIWLYPDPAYPDSYYYVDVGRAIAAGAGLNVDFVWIFAEVGNRIPDPAVLPVPSNAHWLPLASFLPAPFIAVLGPTAPASRAGWGWWGRPIGCPGGGRGAAAAPGATSTTDRRSRGWPGRWRSAASCSSWARGGCASSQPSARSRRPRRAARRCGSGRAPNGTRSP